MLFVPRSPARRTRRTSAASSALSLIRSQKGTVSSLLPARDTPAPGRQSSRSSSISRNSPKETSTTAACMRAWWKGWTGTLMGLSTTSSSGNDRLRGMTRKLVGRIADNTRGFCEPATCATLRPKPGGCTSRSLFLFPRLADLFRPVALLLKHLVQQPLSVIQFRADSGKDVRNLLVVLLLSRGTGVRHLCVQRDEQQVRHRGVGSPLSQRGGSLPQGVAAVCQRPERRWVRRSHGSFPPELAGQLGQPLEDGELGLPGKGGVQLVDDPMLLESSPLVARPETCLHLPEQTIDVRKGILFWGGSWPGFYLLFLLLRIIEERDDVLPGLALLQFLSDVQHAERSLHPGRKVVLCLRHVLLVHSVVHRAERVPKFGEVGHDGSGVEDERRVRAFLELQDLDNGLRLLLALLLRYLRPLLLGSLQFRLQLVLPDQLQLPLLRSLAEFLPVVLDSRGEPFEVDFHHVEVPTLDLVHRELQLQVEVEDVNPEGFQLIQLVGQIVRDVVELVVFLELIVKEPPGGVQDGPHCDEIWDAQVVRGILEHARPHRSPDERTQGDFPVLCLDAAEVSLVSGAQLHLGVDVRLDFANEVRKHLGDEHDAHSPLPELPAGSLYLHEALAGAAEAGQETMYLIVHDEELELRRLGEIRAEDRADRVRDKDVNLSRLQLVHAEDVDFSGLDVAWDVDNLPGMIDLADIAIEGPGICPTHPEELVQGEHPLVIALPQHTAPLGRGVEDDDRDAIEKAFFHDDLGHHALSSSGRACDDAVCRELVYLEQRPLLPLGQLAQERDPLSSLGKGLHVHLDMVALPRLQVLVVPAPEQQEGEQHGRREKVHPELHIEEPKLVERPTHRERSGMSGCLVEERGIDAQDEVPHGKVRRDVQGLQQGDGGVDDEGLLLAEDHALLPVGHHRRDESDIVLPVCQQVMQFQPVDERGAAGDALPERPDLNQQRIHREELARHHRDAHRNLPVNPSGNVDRAVVLALERAEERQSHPPIPS